MLIFLQKKCIRPLSLMSRHIHSQYLITNESNGTREITLCHEKTKNSLSLDMMSHLIEAINSNKDDKSLRAIVLSAKGNVFSAGHNLKELFMIGIGNRVEPAVKLASNLETAVSACDEVGESATLEVTILQGQYHSYFISIYDNCKPQQSNTGVDQHKLIFNKASELMKSIIQSPVPVIAKVNGFATAAGCQLVATCDMIICSDTSKFSTPGANFGIFCSTPGIAVARCVPKSRATYMLFTGEPLSAQQAYESGLVTKVTSAEELDNEVDKIVDKIKRKSRSVIALGKEFFYKQIDLSLLDAYKLGEEIMVKNVNANDGQEGIKSFVEKRKAIWSHE